MLNWLINNKLHLRHRWSKASVLLVPVPSLDKWSKSMHTSKHKICCGDPKLNKPKERNDPFYIFSTYSKWPILSEHYKLRKRNGPFEYNSTIMLCTCVALTDHIFSVLTPSAIPPCGTPFIKQVQYWHSGRVVPFPFSQPMLNSWLRPGGMKRWHHSGQCSNSKFSTVWHKYIKLLSHHCSFSISSLSIIVCPQLKITRVLCFLWVPSCLVCVCSSHMCVNMYL